MRGRPHRHRPLERKKSISLEKLLLAVAMGSREPDTLATIAGRLARLDRSLEPEERDEIKQAAGGQTLNAIINHLLDAVDPDKQQAKARDMFGADEPDKEQLSQAQAELAETALRALQPARVA